MSKIPIFVIKIKVVRLIILLLLVFVAKIGVSQTADSLRNLPITTNISPEKVFFDSLRISINPPMHFFKEDSIFSGFIHLGANASIIIAETEPIVYAVAPYYEAKNFAENNETLMSKDTLYLNNGYWAYQFVIQFIVQEVLVERILLIAGIDGRTIVVTGNYPVEVRNLLFPVFIESFKTLVIEK